MAGLQITPGNPNPTLSWQGGTPGVYLDEMPVDIQTLSNIPVSNIAYVKVLRPGSGIGIGGGGGGTIAVYTKRGEAAGVDPNFKGLNKTPLPGYSPIKEFYSPDYASLDTPRDREDVRITLYWNPFIVFDKKTRKMTVSFYNNDITKKLRVIIEGVNEEGKLTRIEELIQ